MEAVYFDEKGIRAFLKRYGKGPNSKDYEFLMAILLKRFCELQWSQECCMAFKIKDKYANNSGFRHANIEEVYNILRKQIDEDDSVDVAIVRGTINNPEKKGPAFQIKRFGKNPKENNTNTLINYLNNEIPKKYAKTETSLFIIPEPHGKIDFQLVKDSLITENYPFNRIMFAWMNSDKVYIGEIWPEFGMNEYDPHVLIREMYV